MDISVNLVKQLAWSCVWMWYTYSDSWFLYLIVERNGKGNETLWLPLRRACFHINRRYIPCIYIKEKTGGTLFCGGIIIIVMCFRRPWGMFTNASSSNLDPRLELTNPTSIGALSRTMNFPLNSCALPCENSRFHDRWTSTPKLVHHLGENNPSHWSGPLFNVSK